MRLHSLPLFVVAIAALLPAGAAAAPDTATGQLVVSVQFGTRTSLKVSTQFLQFDVAPGGAATVAVDFSAGARTSAGAEVVLSVEPVRALEGPGGAADVEAAVSFTGVGEGTMSGSVAGHRPATVAKWNGSGLRTGRLMFELRASETGTYSLPVRFVLSTP